jgi:hypothetical protein
MQNILKIKVLDKPGRKIAHQLKQEAGLPRRFIMKWRRYKHEKAPQHLRDKLAGHSKFTGISFNGLRKWTQFWQKINLFGISSFAVSLN